MRWRPQAKLQINGVECFSKHLEFFFVVSSGLDAHFEYIDAYYVNIWPVAPVAYQDILQPGIGQFREFEPP